jgi:hypothetical protein
MARWYRRRWFSWHLARARSDPHGPLRRWFRHAVAVVRRLRARGESA